MTGAASAAEWAACVGIGTGTGGVLLGLLKAVLDSDGDRAAESSDAKPDSWPTPQPPALPSRAPQLRARHAAPPLVDETQSLRVVPLHRARHARKAA